MPARHPDSVERYRPIVGKYFDPKDVDQALMVMWHESRGRPTSADPNSQARGLFQLDEGSWRDRISSAGSYYADRDLLVGNDIFDPEANIAVAARVLAERGWSAWSSSFAGRPASPGSFGPSTFWDGSAYVNRGGGVETHSSADVPAGGYPTAPGGIGEPTGESAPPASWAPRDAGMQLLDLLSNQIAGGSRALVEDIDSEGADTLLPDTSPGDDEPVNPGVIPPAQQMGTPAEDLGSRAGQIGASHRKVSDSQFNHPLASGVQPNGNGVFGAPRDHADGTDHEGIDLGGTEGEPFNTLGVGQVTRAEPSAGSGGNVVVIDHGGGVESYYYHIQDNGFMVNVGDRVTAGQNIGLLGSTGNADSAHIHLEVRVNGKPIDPSLYLGDHVDPSVAGGGGQGAKVVS